jgi:hypothetical protein
LLPHYPDLGLLNEVFADCYIECVNDLPGENDVPFVLNVPHDNEEIINASSRDSGAWESASYWVVYVLSGYQSAVDHDRDPDWEEHPHFGVAESKHFDHSIVFLEALRDWGGKKLHEQCTVTHEIGHQVLEDGTHYPDSIMSEFHQTTHLFFTPECIAIIRGKTDSPGSPGP